jgi:serine/threonine protein kinase
MVKQEQYFSGAEALKSIELSKLVRTKNNYISSGYFSDVYYVRDKAGKENKDYVVKFLNRSIDLALWRGLNTMLYKIGLADSTAQLDPNFRSEVGALVDLKGQGIGPDIVYANYDNYYYVIEKMDKTLKRMIQNNSLTPDQIMKLVALGDRYLRSKYFHDDLHTNNIMWSDKLNDFRIIDWGLYLVIKPNTPLNDIVMRKKEKQLFTNNLIWIASLYTLLKIRDSSSDSEKWIAVSENIAHYIKRTRPERKAQYDIFSSTFKNKREVDNDINHIREMQTEWQSSRKKRGGKSNNNTRKSRKYIKS